MVTCAPEIPLGPLLVLQNGPALALAFLYHENSVCHQACPRWTHWLQSTDAKRLICKTKQSKVTPNSSNENGCIHIPCLNGELLTFWIIFNFCWTKTIPTVQWTLKPYLCVCVKSLTYYIYSKFTKPCPMYKLSTIARCKSAQKCSDALTASPVIGPLGCIVSCIYKISSSLRLNCSSSQTSPLFLCLLSFLLLQ